MKKINLKLIALSAFIMLFGVALYTAIANQATTSDAAKINDANLWPKPENPVAPGSEDSPALKVVQISLPLMAQATWMHSKIMSPMMFNGIFPVATH